MATFKQHRAPSLVHYLDSLREEGICRLIHTLVDG